MKVEGAGKKRLFPIGSPLYQASVRPIHDWAMTVLARLKMDGTYNQTQPLQMKTRECKGRAEVLVQGTTLHRRRDWTFVAVSTYIEKIRWYLRLMRWAILQRD